jgi:3-hydroxyisobutyrate dehydrogenase-like beta-hydroxyacid dehydrogenase
MGDRVAFVRLGIMGYPIAGRLIGGAVHCLP